MILFLALALLVLVVVMLALVLALRSARRPEAIDRSRLNVDIFRERCTELDAERDSGRINAAQHAALRAELELLLVDDVGSADAAAPAGRSLSTRALALALLVVIPLLAIGLMLFTGFDRNTRDWLALQSSAARVAVLPAYMDEAAAQRAGLTLRDAARLRQSQLDHHRYAGEWFGLGVSWLDVGMPLLAQQSIRNAQRLAPERVDFTLAAVRLELGLNGRLPDDLKAQLDTLLRTQPDNPEVLMVAGMAAFESDDFATAIRLWEQLLASLPADNQAVPMLRDGIARARAQQKAEADPAAGIRVQVELSPALGTPPPGATLFVIVRAAGGPPMPIAAKKLPATLPATVLLSDADQMIPGAPLRERGPLEVLARLSRSGTPMPASGDLESAAVPVSVPQKQAPLRLQIDQRRP